MNRHRTHENVGKGERLLDSRTGRNHGRDFVGGHALHPAQGVDVLVENYDVGTDSARELRRLTAQRPGAENHHRSRRDAGGAADQQAFAAEFIEHEACADGDSQSARDFRHRLEYRGVAVFVFDDLVPDGRHFALDQTPEVVFRGHRQMPGRNDHLPFLIALALLRLRRRKPDQHFRTQPDLLVGVDDGGARFSIGVVREARLAARTIFEIYTVALLRQRPNTTGRETDPVLKRSAILDQSDVHGTSQRMRISPHSMTCGNPTFNVER